MKNTVLIGGILCASLLASAAVAQEKKIVYASYLSPQHITNPVLEDFFRAVEKDTDGSIKFESHVGGSLLSGRDIPGGVRDGVADAGYFVGSYIPSEMPIDNYIAQFSLWNSEPLVMTGVLNELELFDCPECVDEYRKFNTKFLASYALTPYVYHCKEELRTPEDFKGKRVRGVAAYGDLAKALGAVPINVSPDEAYEALDRGILDCALHSVAAQKARSYGEAAKFVILDPLGGFLGASTFNLRIEKWNSLTPDERAAITKHLPDLVTGAIFNYIAEDEDVKTVYSESGTKFYNADPSFAAAVEEFKAGYREQVIKKGASMGVKDPQAISDTIDRLIGKWRKLLDENGRDKETYARLLNDEIFSRIDTQNPIE